ncbi:MAG: cation:proton antiporter [Patescibacteria group bacterium]
MISTTALFIILLSSLLSAFIFSRFHLPWVAALITAGIVIGPFGLGVVSLDPTLELFGELGLVFLMFMAGLEIKLSSFKLYKRSIVILSLLTAGTPMILGILVATAFGYSMMVSMLIGIIFISSSVAAIIPSLEHAKLLPTKLGKIIIASAMVNDIVALILLSIFLQITNPTTSLPLPLFYGALTLILLGLRWGVPKVRELRMKFGGREGEFEREIRVVFAMLLGTVVLFEVLGLHAITAGFFTGLIVSDAITTDEIKSKLHALAYGIFIPLFFVIVGIKIDIAALLNSQPNTWWLIAALVSFSILGKFISGWAGSWLLEFSRPERKYIGFAMVPQLSTTLATAFVGLQYGLVDQSIITAMIILGIVSVMVSSFGLSASSQAIIKMRKQ